MKYKHYAPNAKVAVVEGEEFDRVVNRVQDYSQIYIWEGKKVGILATDVSENMFNADSVKSMENRGQLSEIAKNCFVCSENLMMKKLM